MHSTTRRLVGAGLAAGSLFGLLAAPVGAGTANGGITLVADTVDCDTSTGQQVIGWYLTNDLGDGITIDSTSIDDSLLTAGSSLDSTVSFGVTSVSNAQTVNGTSRATGDAQGPIELTVNYTLQLVDPTVTAGVSLPGGCAQVVETTTTTTAPASTTTTSAAPAVQAVAAAPKFTG